jgi:hypothetical protein
MSGKQLTDICIELNQSSDNFYFNLRRINGKFHYERTAFF